jgi:hypothetical protein
VRRAIIGLAAGAALILAAPAGAGASGGDTAIGAGTTVFPTPALGVFSAAVSFSAHSDAGGGHPGGYFRARGTLGIPFAFAGPVTCLRVPGNHATLKYRFDSASPAALQGGGIEVFLEDNGAPASGTPDRTFFGPPEPKLLFDASGPGNCDPPLPTLFTVQSGGFTIHDG